MKYYIKYEGIPSPKHSPVIFFKKQYDKNYPLSFVHYNGMIGKEIKHRISIVLSGINYNAYVVLSTDKKLQKDIENYGETDYKTEIYLDEKDRIFIIKEGNGVL